MSYISPSVWDIPEDDDWDEESIWEVEPEEPETDDE